MISELKKICGGERVSSGMEERIVYSYDASRRRGIPEIVVFPESEEEIRDILLLAADKKCPVYTRGAGTGMTGGSLPQNDGIAMVLTRMNRILEIDEKNLIARVQPGVILKDLKDLAEKKGLFYPPDPASAKMATAGGTVAVNSGGLNGVKYGVTKDYVLSLRAVTGGGEIIHTGAGVLKSVTGYDLTRLLVGSEGTLAVITEILFKLVPLPKKRTTMLAVFSSDEDAVSAASAIISEPLLPCVLEFLDETAVWCAWKYREDEILKNAGGLLLVEFDDIEETSNTPDIQNKRAVGICREKGAVRIEETSDPSLRDKLWEIRRCLSPAVYEVGSAKANEDICVPRDRMSRVISKIKIIAEKHDIRVVNFAHAGDGNIHVNFMYDADDEKQVKEVEPAVRELFEMTIKQGGTLTGEHGIGITKSEFLPLEYGENEVRLMRETKRIFDPAFILNPGKIFTGG